MPDDRLGRERLSQAESLGNLPVREAEFDAEWRARVAVAGSEAAKRSDEQSGDEDDDDERVRGPLVLAEGYERWQWGRILGNYHVPFSFLFVIVLSRFILAYNVPFPINSAQFIYSYLFIDSLFNYLLQIFNSLRYENMF